MLNRTLVTRYGQPHSTTHKHILKPNQVVFGISKQELAARRKALLDGLPEGSVVVMLSAKKAIMTNDIPYPFKQKVNFLYLSGFQEPNSALVLQKKGGNPHFTLFCPKRDPKSELWDGHACGVERACELTGADEAADINTFSSYVTSIKSPLYVSNSDLSMFKGRSASPVDTYVEHLRVIKSPAEIQNMRIAGEISSQAFIMAMNHTYVGQTEQFINGLLDFGVQSNGCKRLAYPPVVAGGENAIILHYVSNDDVLRENELLLVDAGGEYHDYASDITRTWPNNGKFNAPQKEIYELVLDIQKKLIEAAVPGNTIQNLQTQCCQLVIAGLKEIGLHSFATQTGYHHVYPHSVGHFLGMDVHDTSSVPTTTPLQPGMVITIEPGLYMPHDPSIPEWFRGIGIRIEDDVVIQAEGLPEILSKDSPKEISEIEELMDGPCSIPLMKEASPKTPKQWRNLWPSLKYYTTPTKYE